MKINFKNNPSAKLRINKGFSLIEMIIYIAIFGMIVTTFVSFSSSMTNTRLHNQMVLEVNDQGEKIMKTITSTIRNASNVNSPTISNTASSLSLTTFLSGTNPTIFSENSGVLYVTEGAGSPIALTNSKVVVSNLTFSNFSFPSTPDIIKISFQLGSSSPSTGPVGTYSFTFNGSGTLRK